MIDPANQLTPTSADRKITFGGILELDDIRVGISGLRVVVPAADAPEGTTVSISLDQFYIASGGAKLFPGKTFGATLSDRLTADDRRPDGTMDDEAFRIAVTFKDGTVEAFQLSVDTLEIRLGTWVTLTARDFLLDTGAGPDDHLVQFDAVGAKVAIGSLQIAGEGRNFAITGDGSFKALSGFGVFVSVGSATGESFKWPAFLPIRIDAIGIQWADVENAPEDFVLILSASVTGIQGLPGLQITGAIQGIRIQPSLLVDGKFPIIGIDSIGVTVTGQMFGGEVSGGLVGGILKLTETYTPIGVFDTTTPVAHRVFYLGLEGTISIAGLAGFGIRIGLSELGPLQVYLSVNVPGGILLEPNSGLSINDFAGGVEFFKTLPSIDDPFALRTSAFQLPTVLTADQWLTQLQAQVALQALTISENPGMSGFAAAFTSPMVITGSAKIFSIYTSQAVFNGQVIVKISTDGKILIIGKLNFAADNISISGRLYADLSKVATGDVTILFLADFPDQVRLLTLYGKLKMGFRNSSGQEVTFDVVEGLDPIATGTAPSLGLGAPTTDGGTADVNVVNQAADKYLDVSYTPPAGASLDLASILGDDGRILTSRNGSIEPLSGVTTANTQSTISTPGKVQVAILFPTGQLNKTVDLTPFAADGDWANPLNGIGHANDVIFGGWDGDFIHGGSGNDAISGAEALETSWAPTYADNDRDGWLEVTGVVETGWNRPFNDGTLLGFDTAAGMFVLYDEYAPMVKILVAGGEWFLNFDHTEGRLDAVATSTRTDGDDVLFGDHGNDWIVGGTGRDTLWGGWGNDLMNADDVLTTNGGLNDQPDTNTSYEDRAFGGAGLDVLIGNTGGDRLIDWVGEFNSFLVPFAPFGIGTVSRQVPPGLYDFLYALSAAQGADFTVAQFSGTILEPRNGEPYGEIGLVTQKDDFWQEQTGGPRDPQPGNVPGGKRDVLRSADFNDSTAQAFFADSGVFTAQDGTLNKGFVGVGSNQARGRFDNISVQVLPPEITLDVTEEFDDGAGLVSEVVAGEWVAGSGALTGTAGSDGAAALALAAVSRLEANAYLEITADIVLAAGARAGVVYDVYSAEEYKFIVLDQATGTVQFGHVVHGVRKVDETVAWTLVAGQQYSMLVTIKGASVSLVLNGAFVRSRAYNSALADGGFGLIVEVGSAGVQSFRVRTDSADATVTSALVLPPPTEPEPDPVEPEPEPVLPPEKPKKK